MDKGEDMNKQDYVNLQLEFCITLFAVIIFHLKKHFIWHCVEEVSTVPIKFTQDCSHNTFISRTENFCLLQHTFAKSSLNAYSQSDL